MDDLFSASEGVSQFQAGQPLAERARPEDLSHFVGQGKVLGEGHLLKSLLVADRLPSLILWGPPGSGKTSFANLVSKTTKCRFISLSAIDTGAKDLKFQGEDARTKLVQFGEKTILFIDEIHRLNKAQQDVLLPYIEKGYLSLIGATTENPSFELNSALLSRCQVIVFEGLDEKAIGAIIDRGLKLVGENVSWTQFSVENIREIIIQSAQGDGRRALNLVENMFRFYVSRGEKPLDASQIKEALTSYVAVRYDKNRDNHYDTISAFIKSIRGSDPDGALYYMVRMLKGGEDPLFIARRLVILASEDVGNADPRALMVAVAAKEAVDFVGLPEAAINLAQAVTYMASAPKSNKSYMGLRAAEAMVEEHPNLEIPLSIRNAPTRMMKSMGYGKDYQYAHNSDTGVTSQTFLPDAISDEKFYEPSTHGYEKNISAYLEWARSQRIVKKKGPNQ